MANVVVYNMEGNEVGTIEFTWFTWQLFNSLPTTVREHRKPRPVPRFPEAEESPGDRRELVMQDRDQPELLSGPAAEWFSLPFREIIPSS